MRGVVRSLRQRGLRKAYTTWHGHVSERAESFRILRLVVRRWQMIQVSRALNHMVYYTTILAGLRSVGTKLRKSSVVAAYNTFKEYAAAAKTRRQSATRTVSRVTRGAEVRALTTWRQYGVARAAALASARRAMGHLRHHGVAMALAKWCEATSEAAQAKGHARQVLTQWFRRLELHALHSWRDWCDERARVVAWAHRLRSGRLVAAVGTWRAATAAKSDARRLMRSVASTFRSTNRARALRTWRENTRAAHETHNTIYAAGARIVHHEKAVGFTTWRDNWAERRAARETMRSVIEHLKHIERAWAFLRWRGHSTKDSREGGLLRQGLGHLRHGLLGLGFRSWVGWSEERATRMAAMRLAMVKVFHRAFYRALVAWKALAFRVAACRTLFGAATDAHLEERAALGRWRRVADALGEHRRLLRTARDAFFGVCRDHLEAAWQAWAGTSLATRRGHALLREGVLRGAALGERQALHALHAYASRPTGRGGGGG